MRCPCRKKSEQRDFAKCCQLYLTGQQIPATAEALMRSRYAAFVFGDANYLASTWHPLTRPPRVDFTPEQEWLLLKVIATSTDGDQATVEFTARSRIAGQAQLLHEVSRFVREGGRWFYVDGDVRERGMN